MKEWLREILAGLLAAAMAAGTAIGAAIQEAPVSGITDSQWWAIGIGAFMAAAAGWKTLLARPPHG